MQVKIKSHELTLSPGQEGAFRRKVEHLAQLASRLSDEASELRLDLFFHQTKRPQDSYECHLTCFVPYNTLRAEARAETLENAMDDVVDKMKTQIDRYKDKVHHLHERKKNG